MEPWQPYLISALIGLLVGIEREKAHPEKKTMGVRTFLLLSLLGATAGGVTEDWLAALITTFSLTLIVLSYFYTGGNGRHDHGMTTEFAAAIIFTVGFVSHQNPLLSAVVGPVVALVLFSKHSLHRFTENIKPSELQAAILILLMAVTVLNFMGLEPVDPWGIFVPRKFGLIVLILAILEFGGYFLAKILGPRKGTLVIGFLGGLVSSTAVLLSNARQSTHPKENVRALVSSAVAAKLAALLLTLLVVAMSSTALLMDLLIPIGAGVIVGAACLLLINRKSSGAAHSLNLRSPLDLRGVLRLAVLLAVILAAVAVAEELLGNKATHLLAFTTGLFELHGLTLATATMVAQKRLPVETAMISMMLAVSASLLAKTVMSWIITRGHFSRYVTFIFAFMALAISISFWLMR